MNIRKPRVWGQVIMPFALILGIVYPNFLQPAWTQDAYNLYSNQVTSVIPAVPLEILMQMQSPYQDAIEKLDPTNEKVALEQGITILKANPNAQRLANAGRISANHRRSVGWCLAGVQDAMDMTGYPLPRIPAAADMPSLLSSDERFAELNVPKDRLPALPPGAIIVWNRSGAHPYGHISITLGGGQESSDHIQPIRPNLTQSYRVFIPRIVS